MRVYVTIDGIDDLIKDMAKMSDKGKSVLDAVAMAGAEYALPLVRTAIPTNNEDDKHLKNNIKIKKVRRKIVTKSSAIVDVGGGGTNYGFHLETGHMTTKGVHVPGNPFMRTTVDSNQEKIGEIMGDEFIRRVGI